jgi:hypothetical protein
MVQDSSYRPEPVQVFLKDWRLKNFKSVHDQVISLSPLTIVVGKNSAGKSTFLQSILFMAQNALSELPHGQSALGYLDLNGDLVSLGTFNEALYDNANEGEKIEISGTISVNQDPGWTFVENAAPLDSEPVRSNSIYFTWNIPILAGPEEGTGIVRATGSSSVVSISDKKIQSISCCDKEGADQNIFQNDNEDQFNFNTKGGIKTYGNLVGDNSQFETEYVSLPEDVDLESASFLIGLPVNGLIKSSKLDVFISRQTAYFNSDRMRQNLRFALNNIARTKEDFLFGEARFRQDEKKPDRPGPFADLDSAISAYVESAKNIILGTPDSNQDTVPITRNSPFLNRRISEQSRSLIPLSRIPFKLNVPTTQGEKTIVLPELKTVPGSSNMVLSEFMTELIPQVLDFWRNVQIRLSKELSNNLKASEIELVRVGENYNPDHNAMRREVLDEFVFNDMSSHLRRFLRKLVYLGPLREAPQDLYPRHQGATNPQIPLGIRGEALARVLFENPLGKYPLPEGTPQPANNLSFFRDALNAWLKKLEIAEVGIKVDKPGHQGYSLMVDGRPLRSLGTGVSQVLPVIALCLLAQQGSLIILEEPELHLNPSIQQRLANFFLEISKSGRQIIAETHSEYLITRLRVLAALNPEDSEQFCFIFAEKDLRKSDSEIVPTRYSRIKPDTEGDLPDWPEGFFDQVSEDIKALLENVLLKDQYIKNQQVNDQEKI